MAAEPNVRVTVVSKRAALRSPNRRMPLTRRTFTIGQSDWQLFEITGSVQKIFVYLHDQLQIGNSALQKGRLAAQFSACLLRFILQTALL